MRLEFLLCVYLHLGYPGLRLLNPMGASGSVRARDLLDVDNEKAKYSPSSSFEPDTPPTSKTSSHRLSERSALLDSIQVKSKAPRNKEGSDQSHQEDVHNLIRGEVRECVVNGESLLKARPSMTTMEMTVNGKKKVSWRI